MFITLAQVVESPPPVPGIFAMMFPMLLFGTLLGITAASMAPRKGRNPFLWFLVGLIPLAGPFVVLLLASRADISLISRINTLEEKLAKITPIPQPPSLLPESNAST